MVTVPRIFIFLDFSNDLSYLYCRTAKPLDGEIIFVKETIDMEKKESEFVAYSVLSENECGKGTYTLYVQSIRVEGRYMIMFMSVSFQIMFFSGYVSRSGIAGSYADFLILLILFSTKITVHC